MNKLIESWEVRIKQYRAEMDATENPIQKAKASANFMMLRDCLKELEKAINYTHCCESDNEQLADHKCKPMVNAYWTYLRCECGKRFKPKDGLITTNIIEDYLKL